MRIGYRAVGAAAGLTVLALGSAVSTAAGAPAGHHPVTAAKAPASQWAQLSSGGVTSHSSIGVSPFGGQVEAVWPQNGGSSQSVQTRSVDQSGQPAGPATAVVSNWADINNFPAILDLGGSRVVAFSGLHSTDTTDPYNGYEYVASSPDGASWTLGQGTLSGGNGAYGSYGTDVVNAGGTPITVYTQNSGPLSFHVGQYPTVPEAPVPDTSLGNAGDTAYNAGVGYDKNSGETEAVWATSTGVIEQMISPAVGSPAQAPKSASNVKSAAKSLAFLEQRMQVASPPDGGAFVGYPVGYPNATKVALWQLGSGHVLVTNSGGNAAAVDAAPGNGATLWLIWWDKGSNALGLVHSTADGIDIARECEVALPLKTNSVWDIEGQGVGKKVDLFINDSKTSSSTPQIYDQVVGCPKPHKHHG